MNWAELILSRAGQQAEVLRLVAEMDLGEEIAARYVQEPHLELSYFLSIYAGKLQQGDSPEVFEEWLRGRMRSLPSLSVQLSADNRFVAQMPSGVYGGLWQLFGDDTLVFTLQTETPQPCTWAGVEGWLREGDVQASGEILPGFKATLPLMLPRRMQAQLPISARFRIEAVEEDRIRLRQIMPPVEAAAQQAGTQAPSVPIVFYAN
mgnify:CR=1 FL=1